MENGVKRISVKMKSPNPLFEKWLTKWRDDAKEKESKMQYTFNIALRSLKKYPLPLQTGKDCMILKGFGVKLSEMLDKKLKEYDSKRNNETYEYTQPVSLKNPTPRRQSNKKSYTPSYRSGGYAILLTLLKKSQDVNFPGYMTKEEIIDNARDLCDKSFIKPDPGTFYTSWSSMSTLISKKLIEKKGNPPKYTLTSEGFEVSLKLIENNENGADDCYVQKIDDNNKKNVNQIKTKAVTKRNKKLDMESEDFFPDDFNSERNLNKPKTYEGCNSFKSWGLTEVTACTSNEVLLIKPSGSQTSEYSEPRSTSNSQISSKLPVDSQTSSVSSSEPKSSIQSNETIIFTPNSFDVILLVDTAETEGLNTNPLDDETKYELNKLGILYEVRHMKVGDFTWIARERTTNNELVLPYVVERKRMDDLGKSIKDGRYHEQKKRLKQSGIQNLMYVIESHGDNKHTGLPLSSLMQAATNTLVQDGFQVKFTDNHRHSMEYLSGFTVLLDKYYKDKTLMSSTKDDIQKHCITDDLISLLTFKEFNKGGSKQKDYTVRDLFIKQIMQLKGVAVEKALAITEKYPTPRLLKDEYDRLGKKGENLLAKIEYGTLKRSVGSVVSNTIYQLYTMKQLP